MIIMQLTVFRVTQKSRREQIWRLNLVHDELHAIHRSQNNPSCNNVHLVNRLIFVEQGCSDKDLLVTTK